MQLRILILAILIPAGAFAAAAAGATGLEVSGVMEAGGKTVVRLIDHDTGSSAWVSLGQTFAGYIVSSYDEQNGNVRLTRNGAVLLLHLEVPKIAAAATGAATTANPAATLAEERAQMQAAVRTRAVQNNLRQIAAARDQYFLEHGTDTVTLSDLVGPDKYIKSLRAVAGEDYSTLELKKGQPLEITLPTGEKISSSP